MTASDPLRIILAPGVFPPDSGGPATFAETIGHAFAARDHVIRVVTNGTTINGERYPFEVTRISRSGSTPKRYVRQIVTLRRAIREFDADIVLANAFDLQTVAAGVSLKVPTVTKVVGDYAWERARRKVGLSDDIETFQTKEYSWQVRFYKYLRTLQTRQMDHVVVPSEYLRNLVHGWGINESQTSVIYNAVDVDAPSVPSDERENQIITVGRLVNWKGVDGVINAFESLAKEHPKTEFHIVGDGPQRDTLEVQADQTGYRNRIVFHGRVSLSRVLELVANSRAFVLNSTYEGLPHVVLEAMACGTPVVASAAGGTPEVVTNEQTGLLVEPNDTAALADAIKRILHDETLRTRLRRNAHTQLDEQFDHDRMIDEYESLLTQLVRR